MKKSLIALAVIAASGAAFAQSSVTMYGLIDANVLSTRSEGTIAFDAAGVPVVGKTTQSGVNLGNGKNGGINSSRFGLKGAEDLGGGLKAIFTLESGFDPSTGANTTAGSVFGRQTYVGFSGGFGEVRLGKTWTPFDDVQGNGAAAFNANAFAPANDVWASNSYQANPANAIYYMTPNMGGFTAAALYSFGENKTATVSAGHVASMNAMYAGGPVMVALSYQVEKAAGANESAKFLQLNASYDLGMVKLLGAAGSVKNGGASLLYSGSTNPAIMNLANAYPVDKTQEYQLGVEVPLSSAFVISGGVSFSKDKIDGVEDIKRKGFGLAASYALSKRTTLYAGFQMAKQNEIEDFIPAEKRRTAGLGIRHTF